MVTEPRKSLENEGLRLTKAALEDEPTKRNSNKTNRQWQMHEAETQRSVKMSSASYLNQRNGYCVDVRNNSTKQLPRPVDKIG